MKFPPEWWKRTVLFSVFAGMLCVLLVLFTGGNRFQNRGVRGGKLKYRLDLLLGGRVLGPKSLATCRRKIEDGSADQLQYKEVAQWEYLYGNKEKCISVLRQGARLSRTDTTCLCFLIEVLVVDGCSVEAIAKERAHTGTDIMVYEMIGEQCTLFGRFTSALEAYERALFLNYQNKVEEDTLAEVCDIIIRRHRPPAGRDSDDSKKDREWVSLLPEEDRNFAIELQRKIAIVQLGLAKGGMSSWTPERFAREHILWCSQTGK